jgi:Zn finger protein HypA/HybF involved in hydrogenase expression
LDHHRKLRKGKKRELVVIHLESGLSIKGSPRKKGEMKVKTEIYCHECDRYIRFSLDKSLNGNHVIKCPKCGHEHCRVIKDGEVTGERWDSRNGQTYYVSAYSTVTAWATSSELTYAGNSNYTDSSYLYSSWTTASS